MNLTSKRMLHFIAGCAGLCALVVSAVPVVQDSFENIASEENTETPPYTYTGHDGWPIAYYKMTVSGASATNFLWTALDGDESTIVATNQSYASGLPITNVTHDQVLNLNTAGTLLSRTFTGTGFRENPIYVDTLIKFTVSEDDPATNSLVGVKAAVFVNVASNLVVYHGLQSGGVTNSIVQPDEKINPSVWYRLTILLGSPDAGFTPGFKVYLNGVAQTNADNMVAGWFITADLQASSVSSVAFQGTGLVDDLVVSDEIAPFTTGGGTPVLLTLSFNSAYGYIVVGGVTNTSGSGSVDSGTEITAGGNDWYNVAAVDGADYGAVSLPAKTATMTLTSSTNANVVISFAQYGVGTTNTYGTVAADAGKVAAWATASGRNYTEADLSGDTWYDDYLFNVNIGTNAKLEIKSITVDDTYAYVTIGTDKAANVVTLSGINGTLKWLTTSDLGTAFSAGGSVDVSSAGDDVTVTIPLTAGNFFKATLE